MDRSHLTLQAHFASLPDPRMDRTKRHHLLDLLVIAICAVMCGADSWVEIEQWGCATATWLRTFLALPNGIPSHDTFGRVFAAMDPVQFQQCFRPEGTRLGAGRHADDDGTSDCVGRQDGAPLA